MPVKPAIIGGALVAAAGLALFFGAATSTPIYSARAGRTCDNCHLTPNEWVDPVLSQRKCSLSCQTCHVDPAGGGMRNASGRFYGRATLPMVATSPRPTQDWDRGVFIGRHDKATTYSHDLPLGPNTFEKSFSYVDSTDDIWGRGTPYGEPTRYGFFQGRYGTINADPFFRIGWDLRFAALASGTIIAFPMQGDIPVLLHPVHHLTLFANTGFRGRASGYSDTFDDSHSPYLREAFVLAHELPYQAYVKAGRFVPSYGLRLDDHTSRIRREFELDGSLPEARVTGVEIGAAPNYPYLQLSYFRMTSRARVPSSFDIFDLDDGWGGAINGGYREVGWSLGGSGMIRRRPLDEGGDTGTLGVYGAFNLWHYRKSLPFSYQAEIDWGRAQRLSGAKATRTAFYQEVDWLFANGVNLLIAHDYADPDHEVSNDHSNRLQGGAQITPIPGVTLDGRLRILVPSQGKTDYDLFVQLRFWN